MGGVGRRGGGDYWLQCQHLKRRRLQAESQREVTGVVLHVCVCGPLLELPVVFGLGREAPDKKEG